MAAKDVDVDFEADSWRKLRFRMLMIFNGGSAIIGLILTGYFPTMYEYIDQITGGQRTSMYYSILVGCAMVMAVISSLAASVYYDFTLDVRGAGLIGLFLCALGNLLYLLPFSIYFPIVGYSLVLCVPFAITAIVSEVFHICDKDQLTPIMGMLIAFKNLGMIMGPTLVFAYSKVDIEWKGWRLNSGNMPALVIGSICLMYVVVTATAKNLAKMQDLKVKRESIESNDLKKYDAKKDDRLPKDNLGFEDEMVWVDKEVPSSDVSVEIKPKTPVRRRSSVAFHFTQPSRENNIEKIIEDGPPKTEVAGDSPPFQSKKSLKSYFRTALKVLSSRSYAVIWMATVVPTFTQYLALFLFTVVSSEYMDWRVEDMVYIRMSTLIGGFLSTFLVIFLSRYCKDIHMTIVQNVLTVLPEALLLIAVNINNSLAQTILIYTAAVVFGSVDSSCDILSASMLGKIVNSEHQGIGEAVRLVGFYFSAAASGFFTDLVFNNMTVGCSVVILMNVVALAMLVYERKRYINN